MKTLALYALLLGVGVMTLRSDMKEERALLYAPLESAELELSDDLFSMDGVEVFPVATPTLAKVNKEYHIYYENKSSETIEVAIRYKAVSGSWQTRGMVPLAPREKVLMGLSAETTYYSYAESTKSRKKKWLGNHPYPIKNSKKKVDFEEQNIWECYDQQVCNVFAVFR